MSSAQNTHGGQEATILSLYTTMYHWGAIVVASGYTDPVTFGAGGNPYGTSVTIGQDGKHKYFVCMFIVLFSVFPTLHMK